MSLQFINQSIGPKERRLIRSHVMKGRNAGRPRPSRRRPRDVVPIEQDIHYSDPTHTEKPNASCNLHYDESLLGLTRLLWNDLALISFPQQLNTESRKLIRQWCLVIGEMLYPPQFCHKIDIMNWIWVQYTFFDEAYFHCALALSASFADPVTDDAKATCDAIKHISKAYKLINQKLSGPEAISDSSIAVVTTLAIFQRVHHQQTTGLIHLDGLCRMVQLRGSMTNLLKENRSLAQKPLRLDIEFALQDGSPTRFNMDDISGNAALSNFRMDQASESAHRNIHPIHGINTNLLHLMLNIISFTDILNSTSEGEKLDPLDYSEFVLVNLYRLIQFAPLGCPRPIHLSDEVLHLTLLAFMTTLLPEYGQHHTKYDLLSDRFRRALQGVICAEYLDAKLMIYALFVGGVSVFHGGDKLWLLPSLAGACKVLNLHEWSDIRHILCEFSWIYSVHDEAGKALWEEIER